MRILKDRSSQCNQFNYPQEGFLTSNEGIFHAKDGCETWQKESNLYANLFSFPDLHTGYAIDTTGALYELIF